MKYKIHTSGSDEYGYSVAIQLSEYDGKLMSFLKRHENYGFEKSGSSAYKDFNTSKEDAKSMYYYHTNHRIHTAIEVSRLVERIKNFIEGVEPTPKKPQKKEVGQMNLEEFHDFVMKFDFLFISKKNNSDENAKRQFIGLPPVEPTFYFHFPNERIEGNSISEVINKSWNYLQKMSDSDRKNISLNRFSLAKNIIYSIEYYKRDSEGVFAKNSAFLKEMIDIDIKKFAFYQKNKQTIEDYYGYFPQEFERDYKDLQEALKNCSHPQHKRIAQFGVDFMKSLNIVLPNNKPENAQKNTEISPKLYQARKKAAELGLKREPDNKLYKARLKAAELALKRLNA